jgi:hypothetical protein
VIAEANSPVVVIYWAVDKYLILLVNVSESITRSIAGCFRFFTLIQCFDRPLGTDARGRVSGGLSIASLHFAADLILRNGLPKVHTPAVETQPDSPA